MERTRRSKRGERSGPLARITRGEGPLSRRGQSQKRAARGGPIKIDRQRRPRLKKQPEKVVQEFRRRFPDLNIPDPGPEPQPLEGQLEPKVIELSGIVWALRTADGIANSFGETQEQKDALFRNILPGMMASREIWERRTAEGIRTFVQTLFEEEL